MPGQLTMYGAPHLFPPLPRQPASLLLSWIEHLFHIDGIGTRVFELVVKGFQMKLGYRGKRGLLKLSGGVAF
jgi:hypothetical protein